MQNSLVLLYFVQSVFVTFKTTAPAIAAAAAAATAVNVRE